MFKQLSNFKNDTTASMHLRFGEVSSVFSWLVILFVIIFVIQLSLKTTVNFLDSIFTNTAALNITIWSLLQNFLGAIIVAAFFYVISSKIIDKLVRDSTYEGLKEEVVKTIKAQSTDEPNELKQKRDKYLNLPHITFHYANEDEIEDIFNDYFKEDIIEKIVKESLDEARGEVSGKFPEVIGAKIAGKTLSKEISTILPSKVSPAEKFRRYQIETINRNQVTLGIELVEVDMSDLTEFEKVVSRLSSEFNIELDEHKLIEKRSALKEKAAEKTIKRLESVDGWVIVEGKFKITDADDNNFECIYSHPVNEFISSNDCKVYVSIILPIDKIEPNFAANYKQSVGKSIPLTVYGKVWQPLDKETGNYKIVITPLAVY